MPHREILEIIKQKGYRLTQQRMLILEELSASKSHPSAEELYHAVRKKLKNVSFGTVYRNLKTLKELGLIMELNFARGYSRYDINALNHQHFACKKCGRVYDIDNPAAVNIEELAIDGEKVEIEGFRLEFYGICTRCR